MVRWFLNRDERLDNEPILSDLQDQSLSAYADLDDKHNPAHLAVQFAFERGWFPEDNFRVINNEFQVDTSITRAEFVYVLVSTLKENSHYPTLIQNVSKAESDCEFPDIQTHPFRQEIIDACRLDLLNGFFKWGF